MLHAAHTAVDAHIVVVEDDEEVIGGAADVVQPLEGQTAAHAAVADYGHDLPAVLATPMCCDSHSQCCRDAVGSMPAGKGVVLALVGRRERAKAAQVPVGGESLPPARQYLVACCLMPHVPDDAVVGRVEDIVQGHRELHHAQATGKVAGVAGHFANDFQPQLVADLRQRLDGQTPKVGRDMYLL